MAMLPKSFCMLGLSSVSIHSPFKKISKSNLYPKTELKEVMLYRVLEEKVGDN